jgi:osmotically-inducible protein OsmY
MLRILIAVLLLSVAACKDGPAGPAQAASPTPATKAQPIPVQTPLPDPNHELAMRVRRALEGAGKIDTPAIDVAVADGTVTLWGSARSLDERRLAGDISAGVQGVKSVRNELVIVRGS